MNPSTMRRSEGPRVDFIALMPAWSFLFAVFVALVGSSAKITQEYERGVIFRLGRLVGARGPGLFFIIPFVDRMVRLDLRTVTFELPAQEVITRDNVTVKVTAVLYFRVLV